MCIFTLLYNLHYIKYHMFTIYKKCKYMEYAVFYCIYYIT